MTSIKHSTQMSSICWNKKNGTSNYIVDNNFSLGKGYGTTLTQYDIC
jgi:hypothetical protein